MRDFLLDDGFLPSCIDLPEETREKVVSQLKLFTRRHSERDLRALRVEGSRLILSLPVDDEHRIVLRRKQGDVTLLFVADNSSVPKLVTSGRETSMGHMVVAPLDALETLLVEERYILLARHLLKVPLTTNELQFRIPEIEKILNAHLPPEARQFHNWWANQKSGKRAQSFAWMAAGWLVSKVDFNASLVRFVRQNLKVEAAG